MEIDVVRNMKIDVVRNMKIDVVRNMEIDVVRNMEIDVVRNMEIEKILRWILVSKKHGVVVEIKVGDTFINKISNLRCMGGVHRL